MLGLLALAGIALAAMQDQHQVWRLLVLLLIAPFAEEALFRAGLQEALLQRGRSAWFSSLATALAFGAAHLLVRNELSALLVVLPALLIGVLYAHRRRLRECVLLHMAFNACWLIWSFLWGATAPQL